MVPRPFQRDNCRLDVVPSDTTQWKSTSESHVSLPSSKGSSRSLSSSGIRSSPRLAGPSATLREYRQSEFTTPNEEGSPPPHYTPTYVDRAVQTASLPTPSLRPFPDTVQYPYVHPYPYPAAFGYNHHLYPHFVLWHPVPGPFVFSAMPVQTQEVAGATNGAGPLTTLFSTSHPLYPYPPHAPPPLQTYSYQPPFDLLHPEHQACPIIAPHPQLPLPLPDSLPLSSEPSSPTITVQSVSTDSLQTASKGLVSTLSPRRAASPIENPLHPLYKSLYSLLLLSECDSRFLAREITGEQLVSVHGVGVWSFRGNTPASLEATKRSAFKAHASRDAWLRVARARTAHYATPGAVRPPLRWVLVDGGNDGDTERTERHSKHKVVLPDDALQTGTEASGEKLYCARAWWDGGLHLGKAATHLQDGGASISYGSLEHSLSTFEVLVGDQQYARWFDVPTGKFLGFCEEQSTPEGGPNLGALSQAGSSMSTPSSVAPQPALPASFTPLEGGREADGMPLFVSQAEYERGWHPGKARLGEDHCCIAYGGGELWVKGFRVLGYNA